MHTGTFFGKYACLYGIQLAAECAAAEHLNGRIQIVQVIAERRHGQAPDGGYQFHCLDPGTGFHFPLQRISHLYGHVLCQSVLQRFHMDGRTAEHHTRNGYTGRREITAADVAVGRAACIFRVRHLLVQHGADAINQLFVRRIGKNMEKNFRSALLFTVLTNPVQLAT